jgi:hypothetical protein
MRLRVCIKACLGLPSLSALGDNNSYCVCELWGAKEIPPEDGPADLPHTTIREHIVDIYTVCPLLSPSADWERCTASAVSAQRAGSFNHRDYAFLAHDRWPTRES